MISNSAAYGAALQAQAAGQPVVLDQGRAYGAVTALPSAYRTLDQSFTQTTSRRPVLPAQAPVMIDAGMPQGTPLSMPSVVATATTYLPSSNSGLQPSDLLHPLPSIVNTAPVVMQSPCADSFSQWVSDNPMLALIGLGALAYFTLGMRMGRD